MTQTDKPPFTFARATIQGRVGRDAETHSLTGGKQVVNFSLAIGGDKKADSDERWPVTWFQVKAWDEQTEAAKRVERGDLVKVRGRLSTEEWKDRNTGEKKSRLVLTASDIEFPADEQIRRPTAESAPIANDLGF